MPIGKPKGRVGDGQGQAGSRHRVRSADDSLERRIGQQIQPQPNGCWLFNGRTDLYGVASVGGGSLSVHRFVYETLVGPIPDGYDIHHLCETPGCCNPEHLTPLTRSEHMRRHPRHYDHGERESVA